MSEVEGIVIVNFIHLQRQDPWICRGGEVAMGGTNKTNLNKSLTD
jgi:hypothetical protein